MAKVKNKFSLFAASAAAILVFSAVAAAQDASNAAADFNAVITTDPAAACQGDAACRTALAQCRDDILVAQTNNQILLEGYNRCVNNLRQALPVKPAKLPPPVCHAGGHLGTDCKCHENEDGTGSVSSDLLPVRQAGNGAVVCVSSSNLYDQVGAMKRRIEALEDKVPGWDEAKTKAEALYEAIQNPTEFKQRWDEVLAWYEGAKNLRNRVDALMRSDREIMGALNRLCPPNLNKPWAPLEERCRPGTQVETRLAVEGVGGHRPGAGGYQGVQGRLEIAYGLPGTQSAVLMSGIAGYLGDQDTGPQYMLGAEGGYRYFFSKEKDTSIDLLAYGQQYWSVHPAGYQSMPDKGMGWEVGVRARLAHCLAEAVCLGGDLGVGGTPRANYWLGPYDMSHGTGVTLNASFGVQGRLPLY